MTTVDDEFLGFGRAQAGFYAFVGGPRPVFRVGVIGLGSIAGVRGRAGVPDGPQPTAPPFHGFAGVIGESRDEPGTAGTSVNNIGVYGQTQEVDNRTPVFLAGVYGTGNARPGVVGWSNQGIGVEGVSGMQGPAVPNLPAAGVLGSSADQPGVIGTSNTHCRGSCFFQQRRHHRPNH